MPAAGLAQQILGVKTQMVFDKAADKVVAVVITGLKAHLHLAVVGGCGADQRLGAQLLRVELIGVALVNQDWQLGFVLT